MAKANERFTIWVDFSPHVNSNKNTNQSEY
jgi:hypothetical protein